MVFAWTATPFPQEEPSSALSKLTVKLEHLSLLCLYLSLLIPLLTMPPKTKGKAKKAKGASASAPSTKQVKKATKHCQVPETLVQGLVVTDT